MYYVIISDDEGGVYLNLGILNCVFYLVVDVLGGYVWERVG